MHNWHPISKLTIVIGLGALAVAWWLDRGSPTDARIAAAGPAAPAGTAALTPAVGPKASPAPTAASEVDRELQPLPPVDAFASMVDRPLFAPARRPNAPAIELAELQVVPRLPEPAAAPEYPSVSFVGSIEENGRVRALLGDAFSVRGVAVGEEVEGWTVLAIEARRVTLGQDGEILELAIFE